MIRQYAAAPCLVGGNLVYLYTVRKNLHLLYDISKYSIFVEVTNNAVEKM